MENRLSMAGKTVLVTGATDGIGLITARELARMGARTLLVGRNPQKTANAAEQVRKETGNPQVETLLADLSVMAEVRGLAEQVRGRTDRLDVLVNNAGAIFVSRQVSIDGYEMTFALNHLSYFLLTHLLLDPLKSSSPARVVNVSSAAHYGGRMYFDDLQLERGFQSWKAYAQSKLANVLFTYELARRLEGTNVTANTLHPGFVATNFGKSNGGFFRSLFGLFQVGAISPDEGAQTSIYLASSSDVDGINGQYFDKQKAVKSSPASYDLDSARRLWEISLELTGLNEKTAA